MPTFYIHVRKAGTETHSVDAESHADALRLYNEGAATLKDDETTEVHSVVVEDLSTGVRIDEGDLEDEPAQAEASNPEPDEAEAAPPFFSLEEFVDRMARFTTPEDEVDLSENEYAVEDFVAGLDDERLCSEYATFMEMVRAARKLMIREG